jgi:hypothetical protein
VVLVEERVAKERRSALGRGAVHLAAERDERLVVAVVDGRRRDDLGWLLPGARRARRAVELRESFPLRCRARTISICTTCSDWLR